MSSTIFSVLELFWCLGVCPPDTWDSELSAAASVAPAGGAGAASGAALGLGGYGMGAVEENVPAGGYVQTAGADVAGGAVLGPDRLHLGAHGEGLVRFICAAECKD